MAERSMHAAADCRMPSIEFLALLGNAHEIWVFDAFYFLSITGDNGCAASAREQSEPLDDALSMPNGV
jgi:hypothetical protein